MRPASKMDIPAGGKTRLQPGGLHIMFIGLKAPLKEGANATLTLTFDDGSRTKVNAPVRAIMQGGGMSHPHPHHAH